MAAFVISGNNDLHFVARVLDRASDYCPRKESDWLANINDLASSKTIPKLVNAIEAFPQLLPPVDGLSHVIDIEEARVLVPKSYRDARNDVLDETYFDVRTSTFTDERWTNGFLEGNGVGALMGALEVADQESDVLVVERLLDWVCARNVFGITARLLALLNERHSSSPLAEAGFTRSEADGLGSIWSIPFSYNPFFAPIKHNSFGHYQQLLNAMTTSSRKGLKGTTMHVFGHDEGVYLLTAPSAGIEGPGTLGNLLGRRKNGDRRFHLCVTDTGNQAVDAIRVVRAMYESTWDMQSPTGIPLGMRFDDDVVLKSTPSPTVKRMSGFADVMYSLFFRGPHRISICETCGCAILEQRKGPEKRFCCDACRVRAKRNADKTSE